MVKKRKWSERGRERVEKERGRGEVNKIEKMNKGKGKRGSGEGWQECDDRQDC